MSPGIVNLRIEAGIRCRGGNRRKRLDDRPAALVIISWLGTMHTFAGFGLLSRSLLASPCRIVNHSAGCPDKILPTSEFHGP